MKRKILFAMLPLVLALIASCLAEPAEVDLDLSAMPASIAYAQAIAMQRDPGQYTGQVVRISGIFNYSEARQRGVVIIADTAGCCETYLDFICADPLQYPEDYPALYARFVLTGRFEPKDDGSGECFLNAAVIEAP